ncbi:fungal-specific transcription factor domain-containing protein [Coprinopsis sp. MPI-PUGE-AT-0042]|nr:fungal-specific transcription factor domain-containing protein [Coprinopsis sp. MPI-PUGE-AT-0042]
MSLEDHQSRNDVERSAFSGPSCSGMEKGNSRAGPLTMTTTRPHRACDSCRRRKIRCSFAQLPSGDLDQCLNCLSIKAKCTFGEYVQARTKRDVQLLEEKVQQAEKRLAQLCPDEKIRRALLDGAIDSLPADLPRGSSRLELFGAGSQSLTDEERSQSLLHHVTTCIRLSTNKYAKRPSPDIKLEEDAPRLIPHNYHQDRTPSLFVGESSDPQLVIRAMRMKQLWETEGRGLSSQESSPSIEPGFASSGREHDALLSGRRPMYWNTPAWEQSSPVVFKSNHSLHKYRFPDPPLMDSLLSLYFEHYNVFLPLIHRLTLERELREGLHHESEAFATTVLLMCALGSRYSDDPEVLLGEEDIERSLRTLRDSLISMTPLEGMAALDEEIERMRERWHVFLGHSRGWKYFEQTQDARSSLATILSPSLYDVQATILSAVFFTYTSSPQASWMVLGVGLRLLQDIGGHRRIRDSSRTISKAQEELLKRACWVLVTLDRMLSMATGRPCALREEEFDVDLPIECDDEYWEHPDPRQRWKQPSGKPSLIAAFVSNIRLLEILNFVLQTIYATKNVLVLWNVDKDTFNKHVLTEIDSALNTWLGSLPPHLVWDANQPHIPFLTQSAVLHMTFYYIQILLHRPFIPTPRRPAKLGFPSLLICTNASRAILNVCGTLVDRRLNVPGTVILSIFSAGIVLLLKAWHTRQARGSDQQFKKDMDEVHKCLRILRVMETRRCCAGRMWDLLNGLASGGEAAITPSSRKGSSPISTNTFNFKNQTSVPYPEGDRSPFSGVDPPPSLSFQGSTGDQQSPATAWWKGHSTNGSVMQHEFLAPSIPFSSSSSLQCVHNPSQVSTAGYHPASSSRQHSTIPQQAPPCSSVGDGGAALNGPSSMFSPMMGGPAQTRLGLSTEVDMQQDFCRPFGNADPLSLDVGMSDVWDWGIPFQEGDPLASLLSGSVMQWQPLQGAMQPSASVGGSSGAGNTGRRQQGPLMGEAVEQSSHGRQADVHSNPWSGLFG